MSLALTTIIPAQKRCLENYSGGRYQGATLILAADKRSGASKAVSSNLWRNWVPVVRNELLNIQSLGRHPNSFPGRRIRCH